MRSSEAGPGFDLELKVQQAAGIVARRLRMGIEDGLYHVTSRPWQRPVVLLGVETTSGQSGVLGSETGSGNTSSVMPASGSADSGRENNSFHLRSDSISRNCPFACPRLLGPKFCADWRWRHGKARWASEFRARECLLGRKHASGCRQTVVRRRRRSVRSGGLVDSVRVQILSALSVALVLLNVIESG